MTTLRDVRGTDDTPMTKTYVGVLVVEAAIIVSLWLIGRTLN